jgi:uncharacterized zinc-type alcohol dehydrogenase-like protein
MSTTMFAASSQGSALTPIQVDLPDLKHDEVEIAVETCGICHSDLSMIDNEWGMSAYPLVAGHEVVGKISAVGSHVKHLTVGQRVGLGWYAGSCNQCEQCLTGNQNRCPQAQPTIVGRHGGFATKVRCQSLWAIPLPASIDPTKAGPLFCGGITVFNPILINSILPIHKVGVVGIGGLGHMALGLLQAWGCEVTAFSTSPSKEAEAKQMGAHFFKSTRDEQHLASITGYFDMILVTVNVALPWDLYINMLKPGGKLHIVGAAPEVKATIFPLIAAERSIGGSPVGSPQNISTMLDFCGRKNISPTTEHFKLSEINKAFDHLKSGKARYRIVLENDLA